MKDQTWFEALNVEIKFQRRFFFDNLTLSLKLGESTAVLGPNGAGKSTLAKLINRNLYPIVKPDSHLKLFGDELINLWQLRQKIGTLTTEIEGRFHPKTTGIEVVLSGLYGATRLGRDQRPNQQQLGSVNALLNRLHLGSIKEEPFGELSDGQKRRLMLARAVVHQPEVLVLDEPTRALDLQACHQLLRDLQELCRKGTTLLLITHRIDAILPEIERVVFIKEGKIINDGPARQLLLDQPLSDLYETPLTVLHHQGFHQVLPNISGCAS